MESVVQCKRNVSASDLSNNPATEVDSGRTRLATNISKERSTKSRECGRRQSEEPHAHKQKLCRFYMSSTCRFGEKCRFYHPKQLSKTPPVDECDGKPAPVVSVHSKRTPSDLNFGMFMKAVKSRPPVARPESVKCETSDGLQQVGCRNSWSRFRMFLCDLED